jgi:hypothetical protein
MHKLFAAASLIVCVSALAGDSSSTPPVPPEQYCFPRSGGPFSSGDGWPLVTIIYSGVTLTTTPFAAVGCQTFPNAVTTLPIGSPSTPTSISPNLTPSGDNFGRSSSAAITPSQNIASNSASAIPSVGDPLGGSTPGLGTGDTVSSIQVSSTPRVDVGTTSSTPIGTPGSVSGSSLGRTPVESGAPMSNGPPGSVSGSNPGGTPVASGALSNSNPTSPVDSGAATRYRSSPSALISRIGASIPSASTTPGNQISKDLNATLELPSAALEALQLAQFLKNLGVFAFNSSSSMNRRRYSGSLLISIIANISKVGPMDNAVQGTY